MPKTRGSNTIANTGSGGGARSRSGGGAGGIGGGGSGIGDLEETEMANRLEERLGEVRTVPVEVESRTRGAMEQVQVTFDPANPGHAAVLSESGNTYDVDLENGTCDCQHFIHRNERCRHIEAAEMARGMLTNGIGGEGNRLGQGQMSGEEAIQTRQDIDNNEEESRRALSGEEQDDNYFYSDHPEEFENNLRELSSRPLPYDHENALNGSNATFGIELEFVGGNADAIARELYQRGICGYDRRMPYHTRAIAGKWRLERDGSVSDGSEGGELVSPVLQDTPKTWKNIEVICEVAKRHGARVNAETGAHVHVGMEPLDTARQRWRRFFKAVAGNEQTLYRVAGGDLGQYRHNYTDYAEPFANNARRGVSERMTLDTPADVNRMAQEVSRRGAYANHNDRYQGINLTNIPDSHAPNTVEFRYFNGSLNPGQIQANVKVAVGVMHTAEKARTKASDEFPVTENQKRRGQMLNNTQDSKDNSSMLRFVDAFFNRKRDKDHILGVLGKNTWRW